jgi:CRP-like cAMP-binding protein
MAPQDEDRIAANKLLASLPTEALQRLLAQAEVVRLAHGDQVIFPDEPIRHMYFPLNCLLSLVTQMRDGSMVESGCIGREGMSGVPVILGAETTPMPTFTQIPGEAVKIRSAVVKAEYERGEHLHDTLNRYIHVVIVVGSQSAACNAVHKVEARAARWLLMSADGIGSDEVNLTHEFLATMLGIRRATVTEICGRLREVGLIRYERGRMEIIDREGLERTACECYGRTKEEYVRIFAA